MHLRISTQKKDNKSYRYVQIVESYRRDDGVSTKRVLAHLGDLPQPTIDAFNMALKAARTGDALILRSEVAQLLAGSTIANRRYLDLAVLADCWRQWDLSALLNELDTNSNTSLSFSDVILPLVLQRCSEPGSKLKATRWVPTTALPELLGLNIAAFHNSRIHRSLETLYQVTEPLQQRLCQKYLNTDGAFGALFMDVTDTYFEGIGCPMAEQTRTKNEMPNKRCLGIVLLANEYGYPLRWKVVGGKTKDWDAMGSLLDEIGDIEWLQQTPVVFDRAMGNQKTVAALKAAQTVKFLTAAHVTSIESYTKNLPFQAFANVAIEGTDESYEQDIERVAQVARSAGLEEINPRLFVIDLGVSLPASELEKAQEDASTKRGAGRPVLAAKHLRQSRAIQKKMADDPTLSRYDMATSLGICIKHLEHQLALLKLAPDVQKRILQWDERFPLGEKYLRFLLSLPSDEQLPALDEQLAMHMSTSGKPTKSEESDEQIGPLHLVAYFNPQLFVDVRRRSAEHCEKLQHHVQTFNAELAAAKRTREYDATYRKFFHEVERLKYLDAFKVELTSITVKSKTGQAISSFQGSITRDEKAWERRRRYDGFVLLLGHPDLPHTAKELVNLYRIKDNVEKDFQTIKSVVKLRPIYSYTDPKVQAHVTLCMMALLLQRTLERRLRVAALPMTAPACIEILKTCHLNQRRNGNDPLYDITQITMEQRQILTALHLEHLADDASLCRLITPRQLPSVKPVGNRQERRTRRR